MTTSSAPNRIDWQILKETLRNAQAAIEQSSTADDDRLRTFFRERAARLAARVTDSHTYSNSVAMLVVIGGVERYGIELKYVAEVFPDVRITPVPGTPEILLGVANLQGEVRSVLGLRRLLGLADAEDDTSRYILLLRHADRQIGLQVDQVSNVRRINLDAIMTADEGAVQDDRYVRGVTADKLAVLRADALFEYTNSRPNQ